MAEFYSARSWEIPPLPWTNLSPPFSPWVIPSRKPGLCLPDLTYYWKLAIPIVVFVDAQLGLIELKQRSSPLPDLAVNFGATDFAAVTKALGGEGVWGARGGALAGDLHDSRRGDRLAIL